MVIALVLLSLMDGGRIRRKDVAALIPTAASLVDVFDDGGGGMRVMKNEGDSTRSSRDVTAQ
jgi:hypothetical protein